MNDVERGNKFWAVLNQFKDPITLKKDYIWLAEGVSLERQIECLVFKTWSVDSPIPTSYHLCNRGDCFRAYRHVAGRAQVVDLEVLDGWLLTAFYNFSAGKVHEKYMTYAGLSTRLESMLRFILVYFQPGNGVPVERVTIKRDIIINALKAFDLENLLPED